MQISELISIRIEGLSVEGSDPFPPAMRTPVFRDDCLAGPPRNHVNSPLPGGKLAPPFTRRRIQRLKLAVAFLGDLVEAHWPRQSHALRDWPYSCVSCGPEFWGRFITHAGTKGRDSSLRSNRLKQNGIPVKF